MLEEMDQEFGIGKIVEDEFSRTKQTDVSFLLSHSTFTCNIP